MTEEEFIEGYRAFFNGGLYLDKKASNWQDWICSFGSLNNEMYYAVFVNSLREEELRLIWQRENSPLANALK